ncbi:unnamed protein product [Periconia digitata]|uniref:F-box domain-containing protein n=1 Tax=Periconia digitata TaxID=1303443 RepID=A0A9W4XT69_9PLEO|nr:unnamed protein product [Periconia digitata]
MEQLPLETLMGIGDWLPREDLQNFRLVNKAFAAAAAPLLFRQLVFHSSYASFNRVHNVAVHPVLRKYVKDIVWDANMYESGLNNIALWEHKTHSGYHRMFHLTPYGDVVEYEQMLPDGEKETLKDNMAVMTKQYMTYRQKIAEENNFMEHILGILTTKFVLDRLTNLTTLRIMTGRFERGVGNTIFKPWNEFGCEVPHTPGNEYHARGRTSNCGILPSGPPGHKALICGIRSMGRTLTSLHIDHLMYMSFDHGIFPHDLATHLPNLKFLELHIMTRVLDDENDVVALSPSDFDEYLKQGALKAFIGGLVSLSGICISLHSVIYDDSMDDPQEPSNTHLEDIIPSDLSNLSRLSIREASVDYSHIVGILQSNARTLTEIELQDITLDPNGSWEDVFRMMRTELRLKSLKVSGWMCEQNGSTVMGGGAVWEIDDAGLGEVLEAFVRAEGSSPFIRKARLV